MNHQPKSRSMRPVMMLFVMCVTLWLAPACYEEDMTIAIGKDIPPTFTLAGSGNLMFFGVWEVAPENQDRAPAQRDGSKDILLWKILPDGLSTDQKVIRRLPKITYGAVPSGFVQNMPASGPPPTLAEGKVYEAGGPASNANGGFIWFTIRDRQVITVEPRGGN